MTSVKIIGAGSIGNHLTNACRTKGFDVTICDIDADALKRTKENIYPSRYGSWDDAIRLAHNDDVANEQFDVVIIGTPPDSHMKLAMAQLEAAAPKVMLIEKPLCPPDLTGTDELRSTAKETSTFVGVAYNHTLTSNTQIAEEWLANHDIGQIETIASMTREYWGGIFKAHPWLAGPHDSYLGFTSRGGGALCEHSHALNIWQHFAHVLGQGKIVEVSAMLDQVKTDKVDYDKLAQLSVKTEKGLVGTVVQDVVTEPAKKWLRIQGAEGFLEWEVNADSNHDAVRTWKGEGEIDVNMISKTRPDDFKNEADHIADILAGKVENSPISLERGLDTMLVAAAAIKSSNEGRTVKIDVAAPSFKEALS